MLSRKVCVESAIQTARIFDQYRAKFDIKQAFVSAMQHIGTAATALIVEIESVNNASDQRQLLSHLITLSECMDSIAETFEPASVMFSVVDHFVRSLGGPSLGEKAKTSQETPGDEQRTWRKFPYTPEYGELMNLEPPQQSPKTGSIGNSHPGEETRYFGNAFAFPMVPSSWFHENWEDNSTSQSFAGLREGQTSATMGHFPDDYLEFFAPSRDEEN
jgi:hypothetical protein